MAGNDFEPVRDLMPEKIRGRGRRCITRALPPGEFAVRLEYSLIEDLERYLDSKDVGNFVDMLERIKVLAAIRGVSWEALEEMRAKKAEEEGSFNENLLLIWEGDRDPPRRRLLCTCERGDHVFEED
ncbi:putative house-cleaning noncanonical NTP pyrophosphatase (MazG superfamily) [Methanolinea mesophila]|uniref:nucleoside triphosphate pyrophosphohydrolase n=1 Tax=Methanolinea mesophila TaxID=547055 RepID=UPI001AE87A18|nr:nucleoside triphosphate pyrophosphohydrolase [Methanolinea mesophila]MBP1929751.1 putative house-cleaning noncanonical NTP pyrophosphatase (MazG superfamily) [Methanolinea mesophila]